MDIPRDPKGYTCLINPETGKMELVLAIIPMPGDPDYHPKSINNYIIVKENLPHPSKLLPRDIHPYKAIPMEIHPSKVDLTPVKDLDNL